jgi:hypothetical protein
VRGEGQRRSSDRAIEGGGRQQGLDHQGGKYNSRKNKRSEHVAAHMWVKLDAVTKDKAHGAIEGHEGAPYKVTIMEEDMHNRSSATGRSPGAKGGVAV